MQKVEIAKKILDSSGLPYRYDHFRESEAVDPPFAVYRNSPQDPFGADGRTYYQETGVDIEIYAETPEDMAEIMSDIEGLLDAEEIYYNKTADTVYIESEDFFESLYEL